MTINTISASPSQTRSSSQTRSRSFSTTRSRSSSQTRSKSQTLTRSRSQSRSRSLSQTRTATPSQVASLGISSSQTLSQMQTPSAQAIEYPIVTTLAGGNGGTESGSADGVGTTATFNNPFGVAQSSDRSFALIVSVCCIATSTFLYLRHSVYPPDPYPLCYAG